MVQRHRHQLIAVVSLVVGALSTWVLAATGTDGDFFRSLGYPWVCAAILLGGLVLGVLTSVKGAVATLVPFTAPQPVVALWQGMHADPGGSGLWVLGFAVSTLLMVFSVGCVAIGVTVRLMFRR
ncbi:hypothetical protein [Sphaerisporangium fuscum]|uniref:hypothetical protein n=1 Tax=Sphaerisporangium fuscum TaxID=2835868 RepID=UPI001BDD8B63|nr:hypothetical protein [Sphaerisporangium fuscum]